ncbi:hypothetical protein WA026_006044 [Henosepilachna vigintioctopunctata]|uniref:Uncharacterized protein n=1 Tax=Henosepilachna vigintioctopunctata TaxID=420089 RepID=A0AAW1TP49_9CUCU
MPESSFIFITSLSISSSSKSGKNTRTVPNFSFKQQTKHNRDEGAVVKTASRQCNSQDASLGTNNACAGSPSNYRSAPTRCGVPHVPHRPSPRIRDKWAPLGQPNAVVLRSKFDATRYINCGV